MIKYNELIYDDRYMDYYPINTNIYIPTSYNMIKCTFSIYSSNI